MKMEDYNTKDRVIVVYTGEGKGKTSASIGLMARALGTNWRVAYIQFIKHWKVGEHDFIKQIEPIFKDKLTFYKGGKGFYNAGELSAKDVSEDEHKQAAKDTLDFAYQCASSGDYDLVVCDEINNAVNDGLITIADQRKLMKDLAPKTSLCMTGRNFKEELLSEVDIATNMAKLRHHFDDKFLANKGIDY